uniref:4F2 cell-surface antigen heavy chain-like n=1 Tax=Hirondellea gigas TaxID=1518452 RepID=A0A2P2HWG7_9CRUS
MGEEKNGVQNSTPNGEMAPQEDSKMPLTEGVEPNVEIVKAGAGDAKIDIPTEEFKGLTKHELMQYANDPFWVRLRILLMFLFWAGWVVMLVLAVFIIVKAPRCEPPPTISWLQENPLIEVDISTKGQPEDAVSLMKSLGISSFYMPNLISPHDYNMLNPDYSAEQVLDMLQALSVDSLKAVTDFVPNPVQSYHTWAKNDSYSDAFMGDSLTLDYSSNFTETELEAVFRHWKSEFNVTGFLVPAEELEKYDYLRNLTAKLNQELEPDEIVIGESAMDISKQLDDLITPGSFKAFVQEVVDSVDWIYYKYKPESEAHQTASPKLMPAVTMSLMLLPGTPILQIPSGQLTDNVTISIVQQCVKLRHKDAIKFGDTQFANTTDNVIAFTRTLKGTPGYAMAINLGLEDDVVDFTKLDHVPEVGTLDYILPGTAEIENKPALNAVPISSHGGVVIQFVAVYE